MKDRASVTAPERKEREKKRTHARDKGKKGVSWRPNHQQSWLLALIRLSPVHTHVHLHTQTHTRTNTKLKISPPQKPHSSISSRPLVHLSFRFISEPENSSPRETPNAGTPELGKEDLSFPKPEISDSAHPDAANLPSLAGYTHWHTLVRVCMRRRDKYMNVHTHVHKHRSTHTHTHTQTHR